MTQLIESSKIDSRVICSCSLAFQLKENFSKIRSYVDFMLGGTLAYKKNFSMCGTYKLTSFGVFRIRCKLPKPFLLDWSLCCWSLYVAAFHPVVLY
jgi:hypothetical protein